MIHLNGNLLCAIDIETTGLDPDKHEIYEISIIPLNGQYDVNPKYMPFDILLKPEKTDNIDWEGMRKTGNADRVVESRLKGFDQFDAADALVDWKDRLKLPEKKRIVPLAHNWGGLDKAFILKWLGPLTFDQVFHFHYRDTMATALFLNDRADLSNEQIPFPKVNLTYLISQLKLDVQGRSHCAADDAMNTARVYKQLLTQL